eukprot:12846598-Ditylum_brightwellii.AAC.1
MTSRKELRRTQRKGRKRRIKISPFNTKPPDSNVKINKPGEGEGGGDRNSASDDQRGQLICSTCNSKPGKFRPLISDIGDFLCDSCYKCHFPATYFCDDDVRGIAPAFRRKVERTTVIIQHHYNTYSEEEECRVCLERGVLRKCCRRYYCHTCYHIKRICPGCGEDAHTTGISSAKNRLHNDPGKFAVASSWCLTLLTSLLILVATATILYNEFTFPTTVWEHKCYGWFPKCNIEVCVDLDVDKDPNNHLPHLIGDAGVPIDYHYCNISSTVNKVVGHACIFDAQLYSRSERSLGFDVCHNAPRETVEDESTLFSNGVYVFDDDFDHWTNKTDFRRESSVNMASARWDSVVNAEASDICGFNSNLSRDYRKFDQSRGIPSRDAALVFSGVHFRHADTIDLDIEYGGHVEFFLKMAPITSDIGATPCKTAYGGDISIACSKDEGRSWYNFASYPVWKYRSNRFKFVKESLPRNCWSNQTRFRFHQPAFDSKRDYWALDDVRIFRSFNPQWYGSEAYLIQKQSRQTNINSAQCCYNTEQCNIFSKNSINSKDEVCENLRSFDENGGTFRLKSVEIFVIMAGVFSLVKIVFIKIRDKVSLNTAHMEDCPMKGGDTNTGIFPQKEFDLSAHLSWQALVMLLLFLSLYFCTSRAIETVITSRTTCASSGGQGQKDGCLDYSKIAVTALAVALDLESICKLLNEVAKYNDGGRTINIFG